MHLQSLQDIEQSNKLTRMVEIWFQKYRNIKWLLDLDELKILQQKPRFKTHKKKISWTIRSLQQLLYFLIYYIYSVLSIFLFFEAIISLRQSMHCIIYYIRFMLMNRAERKWELRTAAQYAKFERWLKSAQCHMIFKKIIQVKDI